MLGFFGIAIDIVCRIWSWLKNRRTNVVIVVKRYELSIVNNTRDTIHITKCGAIDNQKKERVVKDTNTPPTPILPGATIGIGNIVAKNDTFRAKHVFYEDGNYDRHKRRLMRAELLILYPHK